MSSIWDDPYKNPETLKYVNLSTCTIVVGWKKQEEPKSLFSSLRFSKRQGYSLSTQFYFNPSEIEGKEQENELHLKRMANWVESDIRRRLKDRTGLMSSSKTRQDSFYLSLIDCSGILKTSRAPDSLLPDADLEVEYKQFRQDTMILVVATKEMHGGVDNTKTKDSLYTEPIAWHSDHPGGSSWLMFRRFHPSVFDKGREPRARYQGAEPGTNNEGTQGEGQLVSEIDSEPGHSTAPHPSTGPPTVPPGGSNQDVEVTELHSSDEAGSNPEKGEDEGEVQVQVQIDDSTAGPGADSNEGGSAGFDVTVDAGHVQLGDLELDVEVSAGPLESGFSADFSV